jgi:hypothetical protein
MLDFFFFENAVYVVMWEKYCRTGQATDDMVVRRMRIARCIPKATNTHRICNTYCFSTATVVARTRLNVTLCVHCLSFLVLKFLVGEIYF